MDAQTLALEIKSYCISNRSEENIKKYQRFFKEPYDGYGLTAKQVYDIRKELIASKNLELATILESLDKYLIHGKYEEISIGLLCVDCFSKQFTKDIFIRLGNLYSKSLQNWAHADTLGMFILPKFLIKKVVTISDFESWISSPYKFQRRSVPVTFIKAMKVDKENQKYIDFSEVLMNDPEREVHQGMGWFLRESWKINPELTETFLEKWKNKAPRLIMQYACEKMTPEQKARFKKPK